MICLIADDLDLAVVLLAGYLMELNKTISSETAVEVLKSRRPSSNCLRQLCECLKSDSPLVPIKKQVEMTKKAHMTRLFRQIPAKSQRPCFDLLEKMLINIIESKD